MSEPRDPRSGADPQLTQPLPPVTGRPAHDPWAGAEQDAPPVYGARDGRDAGPFPGAWQGAGDPSGRQPWGNAGGNGDGGRDGRRRRFSGGSLVTGMVLAALVGAGAAVGTDALLDDGGTVPAAGGSTTSSIIVNDQDEVNAVTAAAVKASPSVVTISASGGGQNGSGSGVIIDDVGHVLTNTHVVTLDGTTSSPAIEVQLDDGRVLPAEVVGTDPLSDLAVLKVDAPGLTPATLGSLDDVNVGDTAIAIGAPLGLAGTVTDGIVSTLDRTITVASSAAPNTPPEGESEERGNGNDFFFDLPDENGGPGGRSQGSSPSVYLNVIQTDAAINPGNSGGPLIGTDGEVIGINVAIASAGSGTEAGNIGVGFSIPVDTAKRVAEEIINNGRATHGYLGTSVSPAPGGGGRSQAFSDGAAVQQVVPGSPADDAGLEVDDVITRFNGHRIQDASSLTAAVRELPAGGTGSMTFVRDGEERTVEVTVGDAADQR
ncbi:trypsin-like peptidase domain-containing protein [Kocuria sp. CPCC 205292]|uniref:S1C family serine protease n=1 Tax=Kocuria cellulosilytica TaxID=3071451 RepID=UPI0034D78565